MLCTNCGKNEANTHIKSNINGKVTENYLCSECAAKLGYTMSLQSNFDTLFGSMFGFPTLAETNGKEEVCPFCGQSIGEFVSTGKAGCGRCYDTFYDRIIGNIKRIHGKTEHQGKIPGKAGKRIKLENRINSLREEMQQAIKDENFERAAQLRDEIKTESEKNAE